MEYLEQKGERFIIKHKDSIHKFEGKNIEPFRKLYGADIVVNHNGMYLFLEYIEHANILEYYDERI